MQAKRVGDRLEWQGKLPQSLHQDNTLYVFKLIVTGGQLWLANNGVLHWPPAAERHFRVNCHSKPPKWVAEQVFYQIFPDRFANGQPELSVKTAEYLYQDGACKVVQKKWGEPVAASFSKKGAFEFYGGDLQGIINNLAHLEKLGISALYLNPIFSSPSNHKYDCTDYFNVDPHLGGNQKLEELTQELRKREMRIILDGVLNHTSAEHPWLDRYGVGDGSGAYGNERSPYRAYYNFDADENFWTWKGSHCLPKLDLSNHELQEYLYRGENSVLRHWLKPPYHIDGWRLDVVHMLGDGVSAKNNHLRISEFKQAMQQENSDAYLLGEHFFEATAWLQGEQEDGAMNYYGFLRPVRAFLAGSDIAGHPLNIDAAQMNAWLQASRGAIPFANQLAQFNLLNSHDTQRFISVLQEDKQKLSLAVVLLFTYVGVPSIYYGDEIGLAGGDDPDCRRCFPWQENEWDNSLLSLYQTMIALRKDNSCLSSGDLFTLYAQDDCFAFARWLPDTHIIVVINRGDACDIELDISLLGLISEYKDGQTGQTGQKVSVEQGGVTCKLAALSYQILLAEA